MITIDALDAFLAISRLGSFTRAAQALHRSQPAISRRIAMMEEVLGAPLFERIGGVVRLSDAGRAFLPHAEQALAAVRDGRAAVQAQVEGGHGSIALAMVGTLADSHVVSLLRRFARLHENVRVALRTATSREVSELVRSGEATLGLRYFVDPDPDLVSRVVAEETLHLVASAGHPLAGRRLRDVEPLRKETWIGFPASRGGAESAGQLLRRLLAGAGLFDAVVTEVDSLTAQKRLAEAGFGLALLPESSIREELRLGSLSRIEVPPLRAANPVAVVYRRNGYLNAAARALLAMIDEALPQAAPGPPAVTGR